MITVAGSLSRVTALRVAGGSPPPERRSDDDPGSTVSQHERAVRERVQASLVVVLRPPDGRESLGVELSVDRVRTDLVWMKLAPELAEVHVVLAAAQRARPMSRGEGGRLVQEEELREPPRLE